MNEWSMVGPIRYTELCERFISYNLLGEIKLTNKITIEQFGFKFHCPE